MKNARIISAKVFSLVIFLLTSFQLRSSCQEMRDGVSWGINDFTDGRFSTGLFYSRIEVDKKIQTVLPIQLHFLFFYKNALKIELGGSTTAYISDLGSGKFGVGTSSSIALRYDSSFSQDFHYTAKIGIQNSYTAFGNSIVKQKNIGLFLDLVQDISVDPSIDIVCTEGFLYVPARDIVLPTIFVGLRIGRIFSIGLDVTSFWQNQEQRFLKSRSLF